MPKYIVPPEKSQYADLKTARKIARAVVNDNLNKPDNNPEGEGHDDFKSLMMFKYQTADSYPELHQAIFQALHEGVETHPLFLGLTEKLAEAGITFDNLKQYLEDADNEAAPDNDYQNRA